MEFVTLLCEMPSPHCEHGRQRSQCKDCGGSGLCEHGRQRSKCKDCKGANESTNKSHGIRSNAVSSKPSRKRKADALVEDVDITIIGGFSIRASATREGN